VVQTCFVDNNSAQFLRTTHQNSTQGKQNNIINSDIVMYPNPASSFISLQSKNGEDIKQVIITDLTGRKVSCLNYETGKLIAEIDISLLQPGNYIITIITLNNNYIEKLVIIK
jgi:hypothetical protein